MGAVMIGTALFDTRSATVRIRMSSCGNLLFSLIDATVPRLSPAARQGFVRRDARDRRRAGGWCCSRTPPANDCNRFANRPMRSARMTTKTHVSAVSDHPQSNPPRRTGLVGRRRQERPKQISPELIGLLRFPPLLDMKALKMEWRWLGEAIASGSEPSAGTSTSSCVTAKAP